MLLEYCLVSSDRVSGQFSSAHSPHPSPVFYQTWNLKHVTKCNKTKWKEIIWLFRPLPGAEVPIYLFGRVCYIWSPLSCNFSCPCGLGRLKRHVDPVATVAVMQELLGWQLIFLITIFLVCQLSAHRHNLTYLTFSHLQFNDSIQARVLLKADSFSQKSFFGDLYKST